jgi:ribonuclease P protein component
MPGNAMNAPNTPEKIKPTKPDKTRKGGLPKQSLTPVRLRKHADYQRAYAAGRKRQSASMSWFIAPRSAEILNPDGADREFSSARVGLTAGKVLGKAHERNRIKRRMREALRRHLELLPQGADLILHPRRAVLTMEFAKLEAEIVRILTQARTDTARCASRPAVGSPA